MPTLLMLLLPPAALAQEPPPEGSFDAHGFTLAALTPDPRAPLTLDRPVGVTPGRLYAGALLEYAAAPLVRGRYVDGELTERQVLLDDVFALNLSGGYAPTGWLRLGVGLPVFLASTGYLEAEQGVDLGDLRADAMVALLQPGGASGVGLGVVPFVVLPTGSTADYLGSEGVSGGGKAVATVEAGPLTVGGEAGVQFVPAIDLENLQGADRVLLGGHASVLLTPTVGLGLEASGRLPFQASPVAGTDAPAEAAVTARFAGPGGGHAVVGVATAISAGASAAEWRLFLGGGWGSPSTAATRDRDRDGVADDKDTCPTQAETKNGKSDADGCPDEWDPATLSVTVTLDGQPVPGAKILLESPAGKKEGESAATPWAATAARGEKVTALAALGTCLSGEAVVKVGEGKNDVRIPLVPVRNATVSVDVVDASGNPIPEALLDWSSATPGCVPELPVLPPGPTGVGPGTHTVRVWADGYREAHQEVKVSAGEARSVRVTLDRSFVRLSEAQVEILMPVYFEVDADVIKPESLPVLDDVAALLKSHPELAEVEVAGHTDSDGDDAANLELSQRRVNSVRAYLLSKGIEEGRLVARGYGETKPIAPNSTSLGKSLNRRVEFNILQRTVPE